MRTQRKLWKNEIYYKARGKRKNACPRSAEPHELCTGRYPSLFLHSRKEVTFAKVYDRTCDAVISYVGDRQTIIELLRGFHYEDVEVPEGLIENSGRELNNTYQEKLIGKIVFHYARRWILPYPVRICLTSLRSVKYIWKGLTTLAAGKIEVPVLDATAIGVSVLRGDFNTAGSIMFMLGIGELLEEWTHKKSVDDLARTMSLNVGKVWLVSGGRGSVSSDFPDQSRRQSGCSYGKYYSI